MSQGQERTVVVTGCGVVTALAHDLDGTFAALVEGRSGIDEITLFDASGLEVHRAAEVRGFEVREYGPQGKLVKTMDRKIRFAIGAASQAGVQARLTGYDIVRERVGTHLGVGSCPIGIEELAPALRDGGCRAPDDVKGFAQAGMRHLNPLYALQRMPNLATSHVSIHLDARGPSNTSVLDSAAALQAIGESARWIREGVADVVFAGGTDAPVFPFSVMAYSEMEGVCSRTQHRSFSRARDGFVLGEGAGILVLEGGDHARERGARAMAEILGYGSCFDSSPVPHARVSGEDVSHSMVAALAEARLPASELDAVFAAGLATADHDLAETHALRRTVGGGTPIVALKDRLGNTLAAAGGIETACAIQAMQSGTLPAMAEIDPLDPAGELCLVQGRPLCRRVHTVLVNALSLSGLVCSLVMRKSRS